MDEWKMALFEIDDWRVSSQSRLRFLYDHVRRNAHRDDGIVVEFGSYRGSSAIALAMILQECGSDKRVVAFDSFSGFPSFHQEDRLERFEDRAYFSEVFQRKRDEYLNTSGLAHEALKHAPASPVPSRDFSGTSVELMRQKIQHLDLKNIDIVQGPFSVTVPDFFDSNVEAVSACNLDCDLYEGYAIALPRVFQRLTEGGYIHLDEYYSFKYPGAKIATDDFCHREGITPRKQRKTRVGEFERWFLTK